MYKVVYYMSGGSKTSKTFKTLREATLFAIFCTPYQSVSDFYLIKD